MKKLLTLLLISTRAVAAEDAQESSTVELDEVVVSAPFVTSPTDSAKPVTVLSGEKLRTKISGNIGETLKNEPGITTQSFGPGVGSPVIRGQSGPRVRVMQNSLGNNDVSSLSPDHANGVEPLLAEKIEVLRGPATLLYGSGAIGGIVNVIDNRIPEKIPAKIVGGAAEQRYDSSTNETASALKIEGGEQDLGLAYHLNGFYRSHGNLRIGGMAIDEERARTENSSWAGVESFNNSDGMIQGTSGWSRGGSAGLSYIGNAGLIGGAYNYLQNNYGVPSDGVNDAPVHILLEQSKYDFKGQLNQPLPFLEKLRYKFGYTDYKHTEFDGGVAETRFFNEAFENRLELEHKEIAGFKGIFGFQSTHSTFSASGSHAGHGHDDHEEHEDHEEHDEEEHHAEKEASHGHVVPKSDINNYGFFLVESRKHGAFTYEVGGRVELQEIDTEDGQHFSHIPLSGSASVNWKINDQHQLSLAGTHSERAPQIQELLNDGEHHATRSYEIGNRNLGKEYSNNLDLRYQFNSRWFNAELNLFHNWVNDYIYQQRGSRIFNETHAELQDPDECHISDVCMPVMETQQRNAIFKGFEAKVDIPLMQNDYGKLDLSLFGDYTRGRFAGGGNVPRMPPLRYGFQLDYGYQDFAANVRLTRAEAQNFAADNDTSTPGYLLLNLGAQYAVANFHDSKILLFANGRNLLDENIRNSTSYLRNFAPDAGRSAEVGIRVSY
jgi:iron complex outermembrane recepter protein